MFDVENRPYLLRFKFPAGTSRGVMTDKLSWFIKVTCDGKRGIGEAGPLPGLSIDDLPDFGQQLRECCDKLKKAPPPATASQVEQLSKVICGNRLPSVRFAMETALLDWLHGGTRIIYRNDFYAGKQAIPINGLIWMGDKETMQQRMLDKLNEGYSCLKMKIGAINFEEECGILAEIRQHFGADQLTLRVDANGAFSPEDAPRKISRLAAFDLHSIEQPIKAGQADEMHKLCLDSPVPIALDEELIGVDVDARGKELLENIRPQYIILKPSLVGGFAVCRKWIELAESLNIGWWITSALESNIGLNAISQFTAEWKTAAPQGLGTGQLYHNNFPAPLRIKEGMLFYDKMEEWDLSQI